MSRVAEMEQERLDAVEPRPKTPRTRKTRKTSKTRKPKPPEDKPLKLNIGGGDPKKGGFAEREGYVLIDRSVGKEAYPLDYPDGSVDEIVASHILEHFPYEDTMDVLRDWVRALKPGGLLKVAVPDFKWLAKAYLAQHDVNIQGIVMGGHTDENDHHGSIFDTDTLKEMLARVGLQRIGKWKSDAQDCARFDFSCNCMGYKPHGPTQSLENVRAVLAAPRFGPTMHFRCILNACGALRIHTTIVQGCFWWMQICEAMEEALSEGAEYVLALDYDTLFSKEDLLELYHLLQTYPEADAVCALQSKRGEETVLVGLSEEDRAVANNLTFARNLTRIATGHFGCTLFRANKLKSLPRPWMVPVPASDGTWTRGSDAIHPDIQFWHDWAAADQTLYLANKVVVGHMVEEAMWPGYDFKPVYQALADYVKNGIPAEVKR